MEEMAISLTPLRTSCENIGEIIFEDGEFEKQIRKQYSWWLPVVLPCRLRDDSPSRDHSLSGRLSSDVALWLVELRHAGDSDDLLSRLELRVGSEDTASSIRHSDCGNLVDSVQLGAPNITDNDIDCDTYNGVLSSQQIGPDLSSADVIVDSQGVVSDHVNKKSPLITQFNTSQRNHNGSNQDSYSLCQSDVTKLTVRTGGLDEKINDPIGGEVELSWTVNPSYTTVDVGGANWQCRGDCNRERETRFRKLCQSALEELSRTINNELAAICSDGCSISISEKTPEIEPNNTSNEQAQHSFKTPSKSTPQDFGSRSKRDSIESEIPSVLIVDCKSSEGKTSGVNNEENVYQLEPHWQALFINSANDEGLISNLHSVSEESDKCKFGKPMNETCDDVLHDLECIMHCLQGMEDKYANKNSEFVQTEGNQDVEFLLLCDSADEFIEETLQCFKSQWIPSRKEKPVSEASSSFSDDVFLSPVHESYETNIFLSNTSLLKPKEHNNFNINAIFDDGKKPPIPPLRRKKKERYNLVDNTLPSQEIAVRLKSSSVTELDGADDITLKDDVKGDVATLLGDQSDQLFRTTSCHDSIDLCSNEQLTSMSSGESILLPDSCDAHSMTSNQCRTLPIIEPSGENESLSQSSLLEITVPQVRPISSFEFPPCAVSERDENTGSLGRNVKQRIRPVISLQDFSSNIYEDLHRSYSSLDRSRKGSGSSDIAAWKKDLQRSGFFSQDDDYLQSDEWFSSTDHEGRIYFFEENSMESSWILPKISVDDSEVSLKTSLPEASADPLLRGKEGEKRSGSRITKARSLLVNDKKLRDSSNKSTSIPRNFLLSKSRVLREGPLNRTKITENGKKVRKSWAVAHVVLREQFLVFYKDTKVVQPELVIELSEVVLEAGEKMSKRKNVFLVSTAGLQVLCQADDSQLAGDWCSAIKAALENLDKNSKLLTPCPQNEDERCSPLGRSRSLRSRNHDGTIDDQMSGNEEQTKIRNRLKRFFHRRPTRETLASKGIYKDEPVFDNYLEKVCSLEHPRIPKFVQLCIHAIESKEENMKTDGLYRASGNLSHVQKIRLEVDQNNLQVLEKEEDVHVLTGTLKLFFRELKEPLIPFELFTTALATGDLNLDKSAKVRMFQDIVLQLPEPNRDTLAFLLRHLRKVTEYEEYNRMHIPNLAIVFGPTLIWREKECHQNMALEYMQQNLVIEFFLQQFDEIFRNFKLPYS